MKHRTIATVIIGAVIGIAFALLLQRWVLPPSTETTLLQISNEFNRHCPLMVDKLTRFDNTSVDDKEFRFSYTITNLVKDSVNITDLKNYLEPLVHHGIEKYPQAEFFKRNHITISCLYKDRNGVPLTEIKVSPEK
jgi:hypothetical protein